MGPQPSMTDHRQGHRPQREEPLVHNSTRKNDGCSTNDEMNGLPQNPLVVVEDLVAASTAGQRSRDSSRLARFPLFITKSSKHQAPVLLTCLLVLSLSQLAVGQEPTTSPTSLPTLTVVPTTTPPTSIPTGSPIPTASPTTSNIPTRSRAPSLSPTISPSHQPTLTDQPTLSFAPSTGSPTVFPSDLPSVVPTLRPTASYRPSFAPSVSPAPSLSPTDSLIPTFVPSTAPTVSPQPSPAPSQFPSALPTFEKVQISSGKFKQRFDITPPFPLNASDEQIFEGVFASYTTDITDEDLINTTSIILSSVSVETRRNLREEKTSDWFGSFRQLLFSRFQRNLQQILVEVTYSMEYRSLHSNVTGLAGDFRDYVNNNLDQLTNDLQDGGVDVTTSFRAEAIVNEISDPPSLSPSEAPTFPPSIPPSQFPSLVPSVAPSNPPSIPPTNMPTTNPTFSPTLVPSQGGSSSDVNSTVIAVVVVLSSAAVLVALFLYIRKRQRQKEMDFQALAAGGNRRYSTSQASEAPPQPEGGVSAAQQSTVKVSNQKGPNSISDNLTPQVTNRSDPYGGQRDAYMSSAGQYEPGAVAGMISPTDSLLSQKSLLSVGDYNGGESGDEADGTHHLADEFDQYKDKNLEKMRTEVEGNLTNFDGMMSQALTKALMDDDDSPNPKELLWGGQGDSMEIEASALWEVSDWLKRKQGATLDERRSFMQETLNKMVASVRHGVIAPEHASRAIHECAAILGLQLAEDFPEDTIIVTGMRKTVKRENVLEAFQEFGEIHDAAVSANNRGFGLVRFKSPKSVDRAMDRVRTGEIVVQDVAVMCKVLKSEGNNGNRSAPSSFYRPGFPPPQTEMDRQYSGPPSLERQYATSSEPSRPSSAPVTRQASREASVNTDQRDL